MAKVLRMGDGILPTGAPPAGKQGHCYGCGTTFETEENEPTARPAFSPEEYGIKRPGWYVKCPGCGKDVFIDDR